MISQINNDDNQSNSSDFSIDHILNRAGSSRIKKEDDNFTCTNSNNCEKNQVVDAFSWLQCTRYCPPKVPRNQKREGPQKRQLGRHPRIPFTSHQLAVLEDKFRQSPYLSTEEVISLSKRLQLADVRVKIWFQNRRARERREKSVQQCEDESRTAQSSSTSDLIFQKEDLSSPIPVAVNTANQLNLYSFLTPSHFSLPTYFQSVPFEPFVPNFVKEPPIEK